MPKFLYQGRENIEPVPEGEYVVTVVDFEWELSKGDKTRGADILVLKCLIERDGKLTSNKVWDRLVFSDSTGWKVDTFLAAIGAAPEKGQELDFNGDFCEKKIKHARAWASLAIKTYNGKTSNELVAWISKKALPAVEKKAEGSF